MALQFGWIDWLIILVYFALLIILSIRRKHVDASEEHFLLSGRTMTLPAFVATLVSTFYGGILGVGEFGYSYGLVQILLLGLPFYVFSLLFAWLIAGEIQQHHTLTLPEAMQEVYGKKSSTLAAGFIFMLVSPAPYILMLGLIFQYMFGGEGNFILYAVAVALFSVFYVSLGGFDAVVRTDMLQMGLMYLGFFVLFGFAWNHFGSPITLWNQLPEGHRDPSGGHTLQYILVWFFIALWTFVDPSFHQRAAAAKTPGIARRGIVISVICWLIFDFFTLFSALYALEILGPVDRTTMIYPYLANLLLPAGFKGLFFVALLATIMSTMDSYMFISGQTLGRDVLHRYVQRLSSVTMTRVSVFLSSLVGIGLILLYPSVVDLWYVIGTVIIPGLLIPVLGIYLKPLRLPASRVFSYMLMCSGVSLCWLILGTIYATEPGAYAYMGIEPFYPGLFLSLALFTLYKLLEKRVEPSVSA